MWLYYLRHWIAFALLVPLMFGWQYFVNNALMPQGNMFALVVGGGILAAVIGLLHLTGNGS